MLKLSVPRSRRCQVDVWTCGRCGRKAPYHFYAHATRITRMDFCAGKVARSVQDILLAPLRRVTPLKLMTVKEIVDGACSN